VALGGSGQLIPTLAGFCTYPELVELTGWQRGVLLAAIPPVFSFTALTVLKPSARVGCALSALGFLSAAGVLFTLTSSVVLTFVTFELLLLVSLYLLRLTAKSDRILEAVTEMFF
jgi:hypothetical protein